MTETRTFGTGLDNGLPVASEEKPLDNATILAQMREEAQQEVEIEDMRCIVPNRPNFELLIHPSIDYDLLNSFMKRSTKQIKGKREWSPLVFAYQVISHTNIGVAYKGVTVQDSDGDDLTIASNQFWAMFGVNSPQQALSALYGSQGHLIATSQEIVSRAGYGDIDVETGEGGPLDG
jgi:hypothetical protein